MTSLAELICRPGATLDLPDDLEQANEICRERGWTDGLPIIPPTAERVERMLAYCDRPLDAPLVKLPPRWGEATPVRLAANAVMAGCRPEYFPLIVLALEAMCEEPFNLYGIQATTHPCTPLVILNGPVARELGINDHESTTAEGILQMVAGTLAITGANDVYYEAEPVVAFGPEHAATIAAGGFSKADVKEYLFEHARLPLSKFSHENVERRFRIKFPRLAAASLDTLVPIAQHAKDIMVIVLGGAGKHSAFIPTFGGTRSVTRALVRPDGALARSIQELRRTGEGK